MYKKKDVLELLGLQEDLDVTPQEMARDLKVTLYPFNKNRVSHEVQSFAAELQSCLEKEGVSVTPYEEALVKFPISKMIKLFIVSFTGYIFWPLEKVFKIKNSLIGRINPFLLIRLSKRNKIGKGYTIISLGDNKEGNLPMDYVMSFRHNQIVTIIDMPLDIHTSIEFQEHFDKAMDLFVHYMSHIIIGVSRQKVLIYNLNAAHLVFDRQDLGSHIKQFVIPKMAAPIKPLRIKDLDVSNTPISSIIESYKEPLRDLVEGSQLFQNTKLFPPRKLVESLPFRDNFYIWAGKIHLDHRTGMSYGFLARQLPVELSALIPADVFLADNKNASGKNVEIVRGEYYLKMNLHRNDYYLKVPKVTVLTQRSGSDKTSFNPEKDLVLLSMDKGRIGLNLPSNRNAVGYRPSYDTRVILAHAMGNAIVASALYHFDKENVFAKTLSNHGMAICHWHGYFNPVCMPEGWHQHGIGNPHVSCSTEQSAFYALDGKLEKFISVFNAGGEYKGDIHVEPHHGINVCYPSVVGLAEYISKTKDCTVLGNKYLTV